jgi:hypothetical protein
MTLTCRGVWQGGGRTAALHGGHAQGTQRPLWHSAEQVVGAGVAVMEHRFGPIMGRSRLWAFNEV